MNGTQTCRDEHVQTEENALIRAAEWGHLTVVEKLLEYGLDVNSSSQVG